MKDIFYEVIKEASTSTITIDDEKWNIGFNTIIYNNGKEKLEYYNDNNLSTLVIKNEPEFFKLLEEYINKEIDLNRKNINFLHNTKENQIKSLISYLFVNASPMDFANPLEYIKRRILFLEDKTLDEKRYISLKNTFNKAGNSIYLKIDNIKQDIRMETPYRLDFTLIDLNDNDLCFKLPSISYGISEENNEKVCYIYSIQNQKEDTTEKNITKNKKISRMLYQINNDNIEEDVKDVSVSAVLSLSILITLLKRKNIGKMKAILYLPVRYLSRDISANNQTNEEKKELLLQRNDLIQTNITDKFLRTIRRVSSQYEGINIKDLSSVENGYIELDLIDPKYRTNNPMLKSVTNNILGRK